MEIVILEVGGIKASTDNPIPSHDPIISGTPPNLTPSGESEFFSEVDAFLDVEDEFTSSQYVLEKIVSLFDEFAGELTLLKSIPLGIDATDCHPEEEIRLTKRLFKSFSPSPILIKDSDSHMEEIDLSLNLVEPNSRDFAKDVVENISPTKEPQFLNTFPTHPTLQLNTKFQPSSESLFAYVVWIFLPFLVYSVVPCYLLSLRNEDIIFDPGICTSTFSKPDISHR
nr:hypothetical protein [Tanacetum cinerariifolium]